MLKIAAHEDDSNRHLRRCDQSLPEEPTMHHKQLSIREYFLANLPGAVVTLLTEDQQCRFIVFLPSLRITHMILFDRDELENNNLRSLFDWMRENALIETMELAATAQKFIFRNGDMIIGMLPDNPSRCGQV
jgi:hypothetical protein